MLSSRQLTPQQLQNFPALPPPPGVQPNFVNSPSHEPTITVLDAVSFSLVLVAVGVRIFVRARITKIWGWDDCKSFMASEGFPSRLT
jgi:hypothetical protein